MTTTATQLTNRPRMILGPLTTTFTPPSSCSYLGVYGVGGTLAGWQDQTCSQTLGGVAMLENTGCWPPTSSGAEVLTLPLSGRGFYSPGLVCPAGYAGACTATAGGTSGWDVQFSMVEGETALGCCPTGYTCFNSVVKDGQTCLKVATSTVATTATCDSAGALVSGLGAYPRVVTATTTASSSASTTTTTVATLSAWAAMIDVRWRASDLAGSSSVASGSTSTAIASGSTTTTTTTTTASSDNNDNPVSAGAIAGAVIGSVVGVLAVLAAAFFVWRRRRRQSGEREEQRRRLEGGGLDPQQQRRAQQPSVNVKPSELPDLRFIAELPPGAPAELPSGLDGGGELAARRGVHEAST